MSQTPPILKRETADTGREPQRMKTSTMVLLDRLNLRSLLRFYCVVRSGSFANAARILQADKGTVLKHVRLIQDELGIELYLPHQGAGGFKLTKAGEALFEAVAPLVEGVAPAIAAAAKANAGRAIREMEAQ